MITIAKDLEDFSLSIGSIIIHICSLVIFKVKKDSNYDIRISLMETLQKNFTWNLVLTLMIMVYGLVEYRIK